jgi:hypothetical protein
LSQRRACPPQIPTDQAFAALGLPWKMLTEREFVGSPGLAPCIATPAAPRRAVLGTCTAAPLPSPARRAASHWPALARPRCSASPPAAAPLPQVSSLIKYMATDRLYATPEELAAAKSITTLSGKTLTVAKS